MPHASELAINSFMHQWLVHSTCIHELDIQIAFTCIANYLQWICIMFSRILIMMDACGTDRFLPRCLFSATDAVECCGGLRERGRSELLNTLTVYLSPRSHTSPPSKWYSFVMQCRVKATQISRDTRKLSRNNVILHKSSLYLNLNEFCLSQDAVVGTNILVWRLWMLNYSSHIYILHFFLDCSHTTYFCIFSVALLLHFFLFPQI